jgi:hypothetical protein
MDHRSKMDESPDRIEDIKGENGGFHEKPKIKGMATIKLAWRRSKNSLVEPELIAKNYWVKIHEEQATSQLLILYRFLLLRFLHHHPFHQPSRYKTHKSFLQRMRRKRGHNRPPTADLIQRRTCQPPT